MTMEFEFDNKINGHSFLRYSITSTIPTSVLLLDDQDLGKIYGFNNWITLIMGIMSVSSIKY